MGLKKEIIQLKDGKQVAKYASATDAANAIGSIKSNISKCCLGKLKQVNGFTFQYSGNYTNKRSNEGDFKCPYCEFRCKTYNGLAKHNLNSHGNISKEQFLADFAYNGVIPKCACGCGEYVSISYEGGVHFNEYIRGHHARVCNNWGHNKVISNEIANTLDLSQYQSDDIKIKVFPLTSKNKMFAEKEKEEKNGKRLICIFEDELKYKNSIVKNRLDSIFGKYDTKLYARNCEVREILSKDAFDFILKYHIQGYANAKISIGLFHNNELVSVMAFGSLRKNLGSKSVDGEYELIRYCSIPKTLIVGGASKMLKYFERKYNPTKITSYCDKRWSNGNLYYSLGFELDHISKPNYFYVRDGKRENRFKYRKDVLIKEGYNKNKTEEEIMEERGIKRVYDCGNYVFKKELS